MQPAGIQVHGLFEDFHADLLAGCAESEYPIGGTRS